MKYIRFLSLFLLGALPFVFMNCGDDDDGAGGLRLQSLTGSGTSFVTGDPVADLDLFGAFPTADVPLDVEITATFSAPLDNNTVTGAAIQLTAGADQVATTLAVNGAVVTITPDEALDRGTDYTLTVTTGVLTTDGASLSATTNLFFRTAGRGEVTPPREANQQIYVSLDNSTDDRTGNYALANEGAVTYGEDRFGQLNSAAFFDGDATIIEYEEGVNLISPEFSLSVWLRVDTVDHFNAEGNLASMFAIGMGNFNGWQMELRGGNARFDQLVVAQRFTSTDPNAPTPAEDFTVWNLDGQLEDFEINRGADFEANVSGGLQGLLVDKWAHLVYVYNQSENSRFFYINGELVRRTNFNNSTVERIQNITGMVFGPNESQDEPSDPEFISRRLALGFVHGSDSKMWVGTPFGDYSIPTSNHYKGGMDDFRIWDAALTQAEVQQLYNDERP